MKRHYAQHSYAHSNILWITIVGAQTHRPLWRWLSQRETKQWVFFLSSLRWTQNSCRWKQSLCQRTLHAHCGSLFKAFHKNQVYTGRIADLKLSVCKESGSDCTVCVCVCLCRVWITCVSKGFCGCPTNNILTDGQVHTDKHSFLDPAENKLSKPLCSKQNETLTFIVAGRKDRCLRTVVRTLQLH